MTDTFSFNADISQLMNLIVNSFYSNKDIFLRELISNSFDAIEKYRHKCLSESKFVDKNKFKIIIFPDQENKKLIIEDNGIGMTKQDLIDNLGTIARSGTKLFMENIKNMQNNGVEQIGQFGVGFYSVYLIAKSVKVVTKNDDDKLYIWTSDLSAESKSYTIEESTGDIKRGTKIIIDIKDDCMQYLDSVILKDVIKTYSNFNDYLIELFDQEENKFLPANVRNPIWMRSPKDLTDKDYIDFYNKFELNSPPLTWKHFKVEGDISYNCIIYIPKELPPGAIDNFNDIHNMKLYAKRVFIMDNNKDLLPEWCRFLFGVIDSDDLQLNVSREILQQDKMLKKIAQSLTKKVIDFLHELLNNDKDKYITFYNNYSKFLKIGLYNDPKMKSRLQDLILFKHIKNPYEYISLKNYSDNLDKLKVDSNTTVNETTVNDTTVNDTIVNDTTVNETTVNETTNTNTTVNETTNTNTTVNETTVNETTVNETKVNVPVEDELRYRLIYYIYGDNIEYLLNSPNLTYAKSKGYDVLLMNDPIDEYLFQLIKDYNGKFFISLNKEVDMLDKDEFQKVNDYNNKNEDFLKYVKSKLPEDVDKVKFNFYLNDSPSIVTTPQKGLSSNVERIIKSRTLRDDNTEKQVTTRKIFELNNNNVLLKYLMENYSNEDKNEKCTMLIKTLYNVGLLSGGFQIDNPLSICNNVYELLSKYHTME